MTETPLHEQAPINSSDHDNGLHRLIVTVTGIEHPTPVLARVTLRVPGLRDDPTWHRPNVSLRLVLGPEHGDVTRVYTVRTASDETESIEVDVVLHGVDSPMMRWMRDLEIGHELELRGPRPHFQIPEHGGRPVALFLDDTAIPALFALLQAAPEGMHGVGWVATDDVVAFEELPQLPGLRLERIAPGTGFEAQFRGLDDPAGCVVWGAGERDEMRAVRSFFRKEHGLGKDDAAVYGYWKRGTSNTDIDAARLRVYTELLAAGGTVTEMDDLAIEL